MSYEGQVRSLAEQDAGFAGVLAKLNELKKIDRPKILNFSHHDLDGITSAVILRRLLSRYLGAEVTTKLPFAFRLTEQELQDALGEGEFDALLISDKGTFAYYDDFLEKVPEVLIIDHHLEDGMPERCTVLNPSARQEIRSSTSLLCHMLATNLGVADDYDDFFSLLGCRGDFVFDPVSGALAEFARPFVDRVSSKFSSLLEKKSSRPTLFDLLDRERTVLLNQVGEVLHVASLSHLYSRTVGDLEINHGPALVFRALSGLADEGGKLTFTTLEDFVASLPESQKISRVFELFKRDWELLEGRAANAILLEEIQGVGVYLIFAREAPAMQATSFPAILPFVASTKLEEFKKSGGHQHSLTVVFCPKEIGVHISMRGGGGAISCDAMCRRLVERLQERYPDLKDKVGGGGHERAAEFVAEKPVKMYGVMHELIFLVGEMRDKPVQFKASGG